MTDAQGTWLVIGILYVIVCAIRAVALTTNGTRHGHMDPSKGCARAVWWPIDVVLAVLSALFDIFEDD